MYVKQPFNFAGRTGTISFDVSNDTEGTHSTWPELWVTDTPKPTPFTHFSGPGGSIPAKDLVFVFLRCRSTDQGAHLVRIVQATIIFVGLSIHGRSTETT